MPESLPVLVSYAVPGREFLCPLTVEAGTTLQAAIQASGVLTAFPEIDLASQPVGIYAKKQPLDTVLRAHDRVEIYRPLVADPKTSRRKRAEKRATTTSPDQA